jgi:DNA-binding response OmpR family regulator
LTTTFSDEFSIASLYFLVARTLGASIMLNTVKLPLPTILLIDDSISELRVLIDLLSSRKWRTLVSFDGLDGYRKATIKLPDLILLDVRMPGMDGFGVCRRLKADPRTQLIPVIFLTSAEDKEDRLTGLSLGAVDYIIKPYVSEDEVLARLGIHLELSRRLGELPKVSLNETSEQSSLVAAATALLLDNLASPPSPEELALQLGTNEKRLNEDFHQAFSLPIFGWLREQRLRQARQLLSQTETPVAEIAVHCGYSTANFATAFKERFECTPRDFRRRMNQAATPVGESAA